MCDQIHRFARYTIAFERMAATELRLLADRAPELARDLIKLADKFDEHADDAVQLSGRAHNR